MGHADISVTLNTYTNVKFDDACGERLKLPVGKAAFFTNAFTNIAGKNMRNPEKI